MLKRLFNNLIPNRTAVKRQVIPREQHNISRKNISSAAIRIMKVLHEANFAGYLVGGGVRDLLLNGHPKDFDVATDATPEQIKGLFRGARIIGRRFRIVHVRIGREVIEVTTFRASHEDASHAKQAQQTDHGMLTRDNVYGSLETDAVRRDFTINALYYTTEGFAIHDFVGGTRDIKRRLICMIGDPATRYQEDPVRMLRAVRFAAKLGFNIEPKTAKPIPDLAHLLRNISEARMFEEVLKLFMAGAATATFNLLRDYGLLAHLFPATDAILAGGDQQAEELINQAMVNTDKRIRSKQRVTPAFIYATLLWPPMQAELAMLRQQKRNQKVPEIVLQQQAAQSVIRQQLAHTSIPKRFQIPMREIWDLQLRLPQRSGNRALSSFEHARFRAAYDFVLLREQSGENLGGLGDWWTRYQDANEVAREKLVASVDEQGQDKPKRKRRRRKPAAQRNSEDSSAIDAGKDTSSPNAEL